jgi:prepilin-type N-terminal cleavage/methylation domain-containing protein
LGAAFFALRKQHGRKKGLSLATWDADTTREMRNLLRRDEAQAPEGGFTLVEMVVAISVLAVVILSVSGLLESGLKGLAAAKARARGNEFATQGIEDLQRISFNNLGLCSAPTGTPPPGLEINVALNCGSSPTFQNPCNTTTTGTNPAAEYTCVTNNITYTVKRYVAWVDALRTTKRLAVFVEWSDLVGNHRVSQQSSLRAPDQSAITGLAPPTFSSTPTLSTTTLQVDDTGRLTSSSQVQFTALTSSLSKAATTTLLTNIPVHQRNDNLDILVSAGGPFPPYNGFSVTIDSEVFRVIGGAGTNAWTVVADGTAAHAGSPVKFSGDQIFANVQTIAGNGSPQTSTVFLTAGSTPSQVWTGNLDTNTPSATAPFRFGIGKQYVSFGILRAADGKSTSAFASGPLQICPASGCAVTPSPTSPSFVSASATTTATLGSSGVLSADITVSATTRNITSVDSVTMSFLTQAGSKMTALSLKAGTTCPTSASAVAGVECQWVGVIDKEDGHRFNPGTLTLYVTAQQVDDNVNPGTIDNGETAVPATVPSVNLAAS